MDEYAYEWFDDYFTPEIDTVGVIPTVQDPDVIGWKFNDPDFTSWTTNEPDILTNGHNMTNTTQGSTLSETSGGLSSWWDSLSNALGSVVGNTVNAGSTALQSAVNKKLGVTQTPSGQTVTTQQAQAAQNKMIFSAVAVVAVGIAAFYFLRKKSA